MKLVLDKPMQLTIAPPRPQHAWPAEVEFILSALEAGRAVPAGERRERPRAIHREAARLRLFSDGPDALPWVLYSRDADARGMGFITRHRLPLGYGGTVELLARDGSAQAIACVVRRCRETVNGWFEGSLSFNREQWAFAPERRPR